MREHYGITKYVPPLRPSAGDAAEAHPLFVSYTDVENLRNFPAVLAEGEEVVATEKVHGTNCRVGIVAGELMAGSMEVLRPLLGIVLLASSLALLGKAGLDVPVGVLVGVPVALLVVTAIVLRARAAPPAATP